MRHGQHLPAEGAVALEKGFWQVNRSRRAPVERPRY